MTARQRGLQRLEIDPTVASSPLGGALLFALAERAVQLREVARLGLGEPGVKGRDPQRAEHQPKRAGSAGDDGQPGLAKRSQEMRVLDELLEAVLTESSASGWT